MNTPSIGENGMTRLMTFTLAQFHRLKGGYDAGCFYGSVAQVQRYWLFLELIMAQHGATAASYRKHHAREQLHAASLEPGRSYPVSEDYVAMNALFPQLDLDVQSFYVFAKILLGNVAQAIRVYFGSAQGCSLSSHDRFRKCFETYSAQKALDIPSGFAQQLERLQETIVNHRDKQYEHLPETIRPRMVGSFQINDEGHVVVGQGPLAYPDLRNPPRIINAEPLKHLVDRLDDYLTSVLLLLETNQERSCLVPARPNPGSI